ncbi:uncharacterized protein RHOBADRAFT_52245 [Rhodotorula graminis WP1]|uniref:PNK3P-domain-containing protein n=1 Tax=Rhodotorula graminis (strain WP1) TaxID=578459 RepID=A0A194S6T4_RHOGW|nr:uncharacterized protein RHOBADRAFT_52245 [Rhodotorula graminis WP1]KPV76205.1 hypothetical protein RHOBADRAFT_52245 [Rhodotorula graminis WP1]
MSPSAPARVAQTARVAVAPLAASSSTQLPTATASTSTATARPRPPSIATGPAPPTKRPRQRQGEPRPDGSWLPVLASRSLKPDGQGCGHFVYGSPAPSTKIAAFGESPSRSLSRSADPDIDGTIIRTKSGNGIPSSSFDWEFCGPEIVPKLRATYRDGYALILLSNQASSGPSLAANFRKKVPFVAREIGVPLRIMACFDFDEYRKPVSGMWDALVGRFNGGLAVDYAASFYVGDAAGRPADHADTDRKFALNAGVRFLTPEQFFLGRPEDRNFELWGWYPHGYDHALAPPHELLDTTTPLGPLDTPEVVLLVGPRAIGKTSYASRLERLGYVVFTLPKLSTSTSSLAPSLHAALADTLAIDAKGLVIDGSLPTRKARAQVLAAVRSFASTSAPFRSRCVLWTSRTRSAPDGMGSSHDARELVELAKHNSVFRLVTARGGGVQLVEQKELQAWDKTFQVPTLREGFSRITPTRFAFDPALSGGATLGDWAKWLADVYPGKAKKTGRVAVRGLDGAQGA